MPVIIATLWGAFMRIVPTLVGQVLISLGLTTMTYVGLDIALDQFKSGALSAINVLPPEVSGMLGYMKVGQAINIIFSALLARLVYSGLKNGVVKKLGRL